MSLRQITFKVPATLYGYRSQTKRGLAKKHMARRGVKLRRPDTGAKYAQFKDRVLILAIEAGWGGRAKSLESNPVRILVNVYWNKSPRIDISNVLKAVEDSLFYEDRWVLDAHGIAHPHSGPERAEVEVSFDVDNDTDA